MLLDSNLTFALCLLMTFLEMPSCSILVTLKDMNVYNSLGDDHRVRDQQTYAMLLRSMRRTLPSNVHIHIAAEERIYNDIVNAGYANMYDFLHLRESPSFSACFEAVACQSQDEWIVWINARQVLLNYSYLLRDALKPTVSRDVKMTLSVDKSPLLCFDNDKVVSRNELVNRPFDEDTFFSRANLPDVTYYNKSFIALHRDRLDLLKSYDSGSTALVITQSPLFIDQLQSVFSDLQLMSILSSSFV